MTRAVILINLTLHDVVVMPTDDAAAVTIPATGHFARLREQRTTNNEHPSKHSSPTVYQYQ